MAMVLNFATFSVQNLWLKHVHLSLARDLNRYFHFLLILSSVCILMLVGLCQSILLVQSLLLNKLLNHNSIRSYSELKPKPLSYPVRFWLIDLCQSC